MYLQEKGRKFLLCLINNFDFRKYQIQTPITERPLVPQIHLRSSSKGAKDQERRILHRQRKKIPRMTRKTTKSQEKTMKSRLTILKEKKKVTMFRMPVLIITSNMNGYLWIVSEICTKCRRYIS